MSAYIYRITNTVNQKFYIGQTRARGGTAARFTQHCINAHKTNRRGCPKLYAAMRKYGLPQFTLDVLEIVENVNDLDERERWWIAKTQPAYNVAEGGRGGRLTEETRLKISAANKGRKLPARSEEWRAKQRVAQQRKRKPLSPETREKISAALTGRKLSREHAENISGGKRGRKLGPQSPEHVAKRTAARGSYPFSKVESDGASGRTRDEWYWR